MNNLKNEFISKDFIINSNVIKCIKNIDITLDEFLLVLYFINVSKYLDLEDIKLKLGMEEEYIFNAFNNLISKKYIDLDVSNENGNVIEKINLDVFYEKLILSKKIESPSSDIYSVYESSLGRTLNSFEYETINKWIMDGINEDTIKGALKEALMHGVNNFKYIDKIVYEWNKKGVKNDSEEESYIELDDYDWLDGNE